MREKRARMSEDERKAANEKRRAVYARKKLEAKAASQASVECQTETMSQPQILEPQTPKSQTPKAQTPKSQTPKSQTPMQPIPTSPYKTPTAVRKAASRVLTMKGKFPKNPVKMAQVMIFLTHV